MRKTINNNDSFKNAMKVAKRITLTILCCVPVLMAVAVVAEEIIARAKEAKKKEEVETKRDVFK